MKNLSCPHCGEIFTNHSAADGSGKQPEPGDITICAACATPSIFTEDSIRAATADDLKDEPVDKLTDLLFARMAVMASIKRG